MKQILLLKVVFDFGIFWLEMYEKKVNKLNFTGQKCEIIIEM